MTEIVKQRATQNLAPIEHFLGMQKQIPSSVYEQIVRNGRNLLDFGSLVPEPYRTDLVLDWKSKHEQVLLERPIGYQLMKDAQQALTSIPTLKVDLSQKRLNPDTVWEGQDGRKPDIFFGMGGGSQSIIRAVTLETLVMFLTAEALRRKLNLGKIRAIYADRITWTNLPYSPDFLPAGFDQKEILRIRNKGGPEAIEAWKGIQTKINQRMQAKRNIYQMMIRRMGFPENQWDLFLHSQIDDVVDKESYQRYNSTTAAHNQILSSLTGLDEYHYSMEDGIIASLVGGPLGGVKVGWYMRDMDNENGGYIMDEQPFHARHILGEALREDTDGIMRTSLVYALAAPLLYPDAYGNLRKASPYICYDPENMLTLHPDDNVYEKLKATTLSGGGLHFEYSRKFWVGIVNLFEELTGVKLTKVKIGDNAIQIDSHKATFSGERIALKIQAMKDFLLEGIADEVREEWSAFQHDTPTKSQGLPMSLPVSSYFISLGIQEENLYYRIKKMSYDKETLGELAAFYNNNKEKINLTRDLLILLATVYDISHTERISGKDKTKETLQALATIGLNTGIELFLPTGQLLKDVEYNPCGIMLENAVTSGLHINPEVAKYIADLDKNHLGEIINKLEEFLTVVSYPNTDAVRIKAKQLGYNLEDLTDEELKTLQMMAEEFFEGRLKGSTPRNRWRSLYSEIDMIPAAEIKKELPQGVDLRDEIVAFIDAHNGIRDTADALGIPSVRLPDDNILPKILKFQERRIVMAIAQSDQILAKAKNQVRIIAERNKNVEMSDTKIQEVAMKLAEEVIRKIKKGVPPSKDQVETDTLIATYGKLERRSERETQILVQLIESGKYDELFHTCRSVNQLILDHDTTAMPLLFAGVIATAIKDGLLSQSSDDNQGLPLPQFTKADGYTLLTNIPPYDLGNLVNKAVAEMLS